MKKETTIQPNIGRYIDICSDWGFKYIFSGAGPSKDILIKFINDLLGGQWHITGLEYGPTEHLGDTDDRKKVIFDLYCTTDDGRKVIVEMQRMDHEHLRERMVFGTSRLISNEYPKGAKYWDFELPEVIFIGVLEFRLDADERTQYLKYVKLIEEQTSKVSYNKLTYIFLELVNFAKSDSEVTTDIDRWFWLLNNLSRARKIPAFMNKGVFSKVFSISEVSRLKQEERMAYEASLQDKWLWDSAISLAEKRAAEKARVEERAKAEKLLAKERLKVAKAEQEKSKADEEKIQSAKSLKALGILTNEQIAETLKLPIEVVEKL